MSVCVCVFGALSTTTALHKHCKKIIWVPAESSLTFLSVSTMYQVTCLCHIILYDGTILQMSKQACITQPVLRWEFRSIRLMAFLSISSPALYSGCFLWMPLPLPSKTAHPLKPAKMLFLPETFLARPSGPQSSHLGGALEPTQNGSANTQGPVVSISFCSLFSSFTLGA